ncbi:MAG TPA: DUF882 domain-containing protein [Candidatus Acidoferrum sp.]
MSRKTLGIAGTFLLLSAAGGVGWAQTREVSATAEVTPRSQVSSVGKEHSLRLYNTHTGERIEIVYRRGDVFVADALAKLDFFLRDHRTGDLRHFDPRLYDILSDLTAAVGQPGAEIDIICGYRTSSTNEILRAHTTGVAKNSLHIQAEAIDLRMPGVDTLKLRKAALALARGGVGYYPHSDFIHMDVGRVRQWCFECPASLLSGD